MITDKKQLDPEFVRITAQSQLCLAEGNKAPSAIYPSDGSVTVDQLAYSYFGGLRYTLDSSYEGVAIHGYTEESIIRDKIHKLLFGIGAYLRQSFSTMLDVIPLSDRMKLVPYKKTFATPVYEQGDYYSKIILWSYTYTEIEGEPTAIQKYVHVAGRYYLVSGGYTTLDNPDAQDYASDKVLEAEAYLQMGNDYMTPMNRLALLFKGKATVDCINERQYLPGERVCVYLDKRTLLTGWIQKADFKFGHSVRSTLSLVGCDYFPVGGEIIVVYTDVDSGDELYREEENFFPRGWTFTYTPKPTVDMFTSDTVRIVARPTVATLTGTVTSSEQTLTVPCNIELVYDTQTKILEVYGGDDITESTETDISGNTIYITELQGGGSTAVHESEWEVLDE